MKKLLSFAVGLFLAQSAPAVQMTQTERFEMTTNDIRHEQVYVLAGQARVAGTVTDDLFIFGNAIDLSGSAGNDAWLVGNVISVSGNVADHLRVAGHSIHISGTMSNSLGAAGTAVQIATNAFIKNSATVLASSASVEGHIGGNLRVIAEQATIAGTCDGNVRIIASDIVVTPGAVIGGDLIYTAGKELILDSKVTLRGELIREEMQQPARPTISRTQLAVVQTILLLGAILAGLVFTGIFPRFSANAAGALRHSPLRCAFVGVLGFCLIPMLAMMAMLTFIGIPLCLLLLTGFGLMLYVGKICVALMIGGLLMGTPVYSFKRAIALLLGLILIYAAPLLPAAGSLIWFLVAFIGLGAVLTTLFDSQRSPATTPPDLPNVGT